VRRIHLNAFMSLNGYLDGAWRLPGSDPLCGTDISYFVDAAKTAEGGDMDAVFIADSLSQWADVRRRPTGTFEPTVMAAAMLSATTTIGVIVTLSTTFNEPYNVARRLASLDHLSAGRIGWNVVTSSTNEAARNFGLDEMPSHDDRYERCSEFIDVCIGLWQSWDGDAIVADKRHHWAVPELVRAIDHTGRHFRVRGPLDVPRSPQVVPLIVQAGTSAQGQSLAARHADVVFTVSQSMDAAVHRRGLLRDGASQLKRRAVKVLPGLVPVLGSTRRRARARLAELEDLIDIDLATRQLERSLAIPQGRLNPADPFPSEIPPVEEVLGNQSFYRVIWEMAGSGRHTVADVARTMSSARGYLTVVGTPRDVADTMEAWVDGGAADGFNVVFPVLPAGLEEFTTDVIPLLRARGRRPALGGGARHLRDRFGCPWTP
jgi:FMN-dependent oxidoreductase (nitrilotriacetate monooxygenase family)